MSVNVPRRSETLCGNGHVWRVGNQRQRHFACVNVICGGWSWVTLRVALVSLRVFALCCILCCCMCGSFCVYSGDALRVYFFIKGF